MAIESNAIVQCWWIQYATNYSESSQGFATCSISCANSSTDFIVSFLASQIANVNFNNFPTKIFILELRKGTDYLCRGRYLFADDWRMKTTPEDNLLSLEIEVIIWSNAFVFGFWKFSLRTEVQICGYYSRKNNDVAQKWNGKIPICIYGRP